jgi:hypothetical protein
MRKPIGLRCLATSDLILFGLLLVSALATLVPSAFSAPVPGDCTSYCQMRTDFKTKSGTTTLCTKYGDAQCHLCTGSGHSCQWNSPIGSTCMAGVIAQVQVSYCDSCPEICVILGNSGSAEATCSSCTPVDPKDVWHWCQ